MLDVIRLLQMDPLNQHHAIGKFISDGFEKSKINLLADKQTYRSYIQKIDKMVIKNFNKYK